MTSATPATAALDHAGVAYTLHPYAHDPRATGYGEEAAAALGVDPDRIFKTLIVLVDHTALACCVLPVSEQLDLKAAGAAAGGKRAELADPARAERTTGYVLGGISPLAHRSRVPVVLDETAQLWDTVYVSAGRRGLQVELVPSDLLAVADATYAELTARR